MVSASFFVLVLLARGVACDVACGDGDSCQSLVDGVDVNLLQTGLVVDSETQASGKNEPSCARWCATNADSWSTKCRYPGRACSTCAACATAASSACEPWCARNTNPWARKCEYNTRACGACDECQETATTATTAQAMPAHCQLSGDSETRYCTGTWTNTNLRSVGDGTANSICGAGWHICGQSGDVSAVQEVRNKITPSYCHEISGKFVAAMPHALPAYNEACQSAQSDQSFVDFGCPNSGWGSEPICCGNGCSHQGPSCPGHMWENGQTWCQCTNGCGDFPSSQADGVICCPDQAEETQAPLALDQRPNKDAANQNIWVESADGQSAKCIGSSGSNQLTALDTSNTPPASPRSTYVGYCQEFTITAPSAPISFPFSAYPIRATETGPGNATLYGIRANAEWPAGLHDSGFKRNAWWRPHPRAASNPTNDEREKKQFFIVPAGENAYYIAFPRTRWGQGHGIACYTINDANDRVAAVPENAPSVNPDCTDHPNSAAQIARCCESMNARKWILTLPQ